MLGRQTLCVTNRCNLSCTYCWYETGLASYPDQMLPASRYADWFARCARTASLDLAFLTGGEPTLRADFDEVLEVAHRYFGHVVVMSNGTTLTGERCEVLRRFGTEVHVSVDHVSAATPDRVRGGTGRTLQGLRTLGDLAVPTQITFVVTARNHAELPAVVALCREAGFTLEVNAVALPPVHPLSIGSLPVEVRRGLADQLVAAGDLIGRPSYYARLRQYLVSGVVRPLSRCRAVAEGIFVEADGSVYLCGQRRNGLDRLGVVHTAEPHEILAAQRRATEHRPAGPCVSLDCLTIA
jgi:MoaA/NifB/PqqE/SkfB family radical SAM enzyme